MRKEYYKYAWILLLPFLFSFTGQKEKLPFRDSNLSIDKRIDDLLSRLTLEEKVKQMMNNTPAIERLGIPPYDWWNEALHGVARSGIATVFPQAIGMAATFDEQAVYESFDIISDEARAKYHDYQKKNEYGTYMGLTFWTPNVNIFRDPRWGRGMETYGEDPYLTSRMGVAAVKGLQGNDGQYYKSHACAKHYAVHSGPEWNRHVFDADATSRDLRETYLPAFEALVREGDVREVMCAYNRYKGSPCCGNTFLLHDVLRKEWGFKGIVVSDCGGIDDFWIKYPNDKRHETHPDAASASVDAIRAGTDLECGSSYNAVLDAVKKGMIAESEVDTNLKRVLRGRFELGMFDDDKNVRWASIPYSVVDSKKHKQKALEMAQKSIVLLKNENQALPLSKNMKKIAVIGPNANDSVMLWANYNGYPSSTKTILQGITDALPNTEVYYEKGCGLTEDYMTIEFANEITSNGKKGFDATYYGNTELKGAPIIKQNPHIIRFTTAGGTQYASNVPINNFSAVYTGEFVAPKSAEVCYTITGDDGFRVYINDKLVIDEWHMHAPLTKTYIQKIAKGKTYKVKIEYFQASGEGQLDFSITERKPLDFKKIVEDAKSADAIVFVGGISPMLEGEEMPVEVEGFKKGDRTDINLPAVQLSLLKELKKTNKPIIFVLCSGSAVDLSWPKENANAVIAAWYGGQAAGTAVASVLVGDYNPAGRLPLTFYKSIDQLGNFLDYSMKGRTYRYMEQEPLYPFGYGLSYSKFKLNDMTLSKTKMNVNGAVDLTLNLQNVSDRGGDEVIQVYVKNNADKEGPIKSLRSFKRITVGANKSLPVSITLPSSSFSTYYDDSQKMEVRPGKYTIWVGSSSLEKDLQKFDFEIE